MFSLCSKQKKRPLFAVSFCYKFFCFFSYSSVCFAMMFPTTYPIMQEQANPTGIKIAFNIIMSSCFCFIIFLIFMQEYFDFFGQKSNLEYYKCVKQKFCFIFIDFSCGTFCENSASQVHLLYMKIAAAGAKWLLHFFAEICVNIWTKLKNGILYIV